MRNRDLEVRPGEFKRAERWQTLFTYEVYSCLAVALRIRRAGVGFMGHFTTDPDDPPLPRVREMAKVAASEAGNPTMVTAWAAGCAAVYDEVETAALKQNVVDILEGYQFRLASTLWLPSDDYAINIARLNCSRAFFTAPAVTSGYWRDANGEPY